MRWRRADGSVLHLLVSGELRPDAAGRFLGYWGVTRDTDELARARRRRCAIPEAGVSTLVTTSPDMITLTDMATGRYVMVNDTFARATGATRARRRPAAPRSSWAWGPDQSGARSSSVACAPDRRVQDMPIEFVDRNGRPFTLLISRLGIRAGGREIPRAQRPRHHRERAHAAHEAVKLANASLGIAFTREGRFVQANPALRRCSAGEPGTPTQRAGRGVGERPRNTPRSAP